MDKSKIKKLIIENQQLKKQIEDLQQKLQTNYREESSDEEKTQKQSRRSKINGNWEILAGSVDDVMMILTPDHVIEDVNDAGMRLFSASKNEILGKKCYEIMHDAKAPLPNCHLHHAKKSESTCDTTYYEKKYDAWFSVKCSPVFNDDGEIVRFVNTIREISQLKQAEQSLKERKKKYRDLYNNTPVMLHSINTEGKITDVNDYWLKKMGYNREVVLNKKSLEFLTEESQRIFKQRASELWEFGRLKKIEIKARRKDGKLLFLEASSYVEYDEENKPLRAYTYLEDVTQRKKSEQALAKSRAKYLRLFNNSNSMIIEVDADTYEIISCNPAMAKSLGRRADDLTGKDIRDIMPQSLMDTRIVHGEKALKENKIQVFEDERNGRYFLNNFIPVFEGDKRYIQTVTFDITERKEIENALAESRQKYKDLFEFMEEAFLRADRGGNIILANNAAAKIFGYKSADDLLGQHMELLYADPVERSKVLEQVKTNEVVYNYEIEVKRTDGTTTWVLCNLKIVKDHNGNFMGTEGIFREISELKQALSKLKERIKELEALYQISLIAEDSSKPLEDILNEIMWIIPPSMQFPEICEARITYKNYTFQTPGFETSEYILRRDLKSNNKKVGFLEIVYIGYPFPEKHEAVFLPEEERLIHMLAERIGKIIERINAEEILQEQKERLLRTENLAHVGSWDWDIATDTVIWSEELHRIFGIPQEQGAVSWADHHKIYTTESFKKLGEAVRDCFSTGKSYAMDLDIVRAGGQLRHCLVNGYAEKDEHGNVYKLFGSLQDITDRKKAEQDLKESEERYRAMFHDNKSVMLLIDSETGAIEKANDAALQYYGYSLDEITNLKISDINALSEQEVRQEMQCAIKENKNYFEFRHRLANGDIRDVKVYSGKIEIEHKKLLYSIIHDVTAQKEAKITLKESKERLDLAMVATNDGIWDWDVATGEVYFDARYFTMAGYEPNAFPHAFNEWEKRVHPDDIDEAKGEIQKHLKGASNNFDIEFRFQRKDKKWMWLRGRGKAVEKDEQGNVKRMIGTHSDITERKQTEWAIQEMLSLYQTLDEKNYKEILKIGLEIGIEVCESEIGYLHFVAPDEQSISMQFWSKETIKNCKVDVDNMHAYTLDESGVWADCVRLRKPVVHNDYQGLKNKRALPKGHAPVKNHMSVPVFEGNKIVAIMGVGNKAADYAETDSTLLSLVAGNIWNMYSRMQVEQSLKDSKERLSEIITNQGEGIGFVDANECFVFANPAAEKIFGVDPGKLTERSVEEFVSGEDYKRIEGQTKLRRKGEKSAYEVGIIQPGGKKVPIIITATPKFNDKGEFLGVFGVFRDITDIKKAQKLQNELAIAQNSAKLKERFLANISHEMRTPMNGIIGMSDFLAQTKLDEQQKDYVTTIKDSSESLLNIINDVLSLSKLEQGQVSFTIENIVLREFINTTISIFRAQALNKKLKLSVDISDTIPQHIITDKQHLRQILYNLISNAVKYTNEGSINIHVEEIERVGDNVCIRITVKDTGIGINESNKKKIFDPFVRVDESLTRTTEGTGLGLTITKRLVEELGGALHFESQEGTGSTFWFDFQAEIGDDVINKKEEKVPLKSENLKLHVLIAEDKKLNQKVAGMILKSMGCTFEIAKNGLEVIEKFKESKYDIILMDIMMPKMDGIEAMKKLKSKYKALPPIIGLSAHALEGDAERFIEMGMDDYLEKPINKDKLAEKLNKWAVSASLDSGGSTKLDNGE